MYSDHDVPSSPLSEVPPVAACATCGQASCEGCAQEAQRAPARPPGRLPWDQGAFSWRSFLETCLLTAEAPEHAFGGLESRGVGRAVLFATLAETLAISSLLAGLLIFGFIVAPRVTANLLRSGQALGLLVGLVLCLSAGMILLHALWGEFLERGVHSGGRVASRTQGLRFGLYACGWDFLTSPAGLLAAVLLRGRAFLSPLWAATRVPRKAMHHYLSGTRKLPPEVEAVALRRMARLFLLTGVPFFLLALAAGIALTLGGLA